MLFLFFKKNTPYRNVDNAFFIFNDWGACLVFFFTRFVRTILKYVPIFGSFRVFCCCCDFYCSESVSNLSHAAQTWTGNKAFQQWGIAFCANEINFELSFHRPNWAAKLFTARFWCIAFWSYAKDHIIELATGKGMRMYLTSQVECNNNLGEKNYWIWFGQIID